MFIFNNKEIDQNIIEKKEISNKEIKCSKCEGKFKVSSNSKNATRNTLILNTKPYIEYYYINCPYCDELNIIWAKSKNNIEERK